MRLGLIQMTSGRRISENIDYLSTEVEKAVGQGAELVTMPETCHLMEDRRDQVLKTATFEAEDSSLKALCSLAKRFAVWLHVGSLIIKEADNRLVNRSYMIDQTGLIRARYDKIHLFDVALPSGEIHRESALYRAGRHAVAIETPMGIYGLSICYDLRFAGLYRLLAQAGAQILMVPSAFTKQTGTAHWHTLLRARAIENGCYVVAAAQTGIHENGRQTYGHSLVVNPWGEVVFDAGETVGVSVFDLDLTEVEAARSKIPAVSLEPSYTLDYISIL